MARYYEENALIEFVKQHTPTINGETTMECVERAIRNAPPADVVPKSEVVAMMQWVAREIFEEIERVGEIYENRAETVCYFPNGFLAELKKKYIGE